jgi:hypothetical protein
MSHPNDRLRGHKLLPKDIAARIPALMSTDGQGDDALVQVKYFTPDSSWSWYVLEYSPEHRLFFGWVIDASAPHFAELGSFSLDELEAARGPLGLPIERDLYFVPQSLWEVKAQHGR